MKFLGKIIKCQIILGLLLSLEQTSAYPTTSDSGTDRELKGPADKNERVRTTFDLNTKYTNMGPLHGGVANLMSIGLTIPATPQTQISSYPLGITSVSTNQVSSVPSVVANLQPQPNFMQAPSQSPYAPIYSGGWSVVTTPTPAPAPVSTLALETSLNMDSAGAMSSYHEEYLHLLGTLYSPAMASTQYGSDSYHGLYGNSSQGSSGTQSSFQDSVGHLEGGTSQLYNIATLGDQNQAISNGFSNAIGTGNVVHQSSSDIIHPSQKIKIEEESTKGRNLNSQTA